jgi:hypothetical protein
MAQRVEFEGIVHEFPADFTAQDISKALSNTQQQAATQERAPLFTAENPLGMVGRAATEALEDTAALPIRGAKNVLKGSVGGLVDLVNIAPQAINLLPYEQGVKPFSDNPVLGSQFIEDAFKDTFGQLSQPQTRLGATVDLATEIASGFVPVVGNAAKAIPYAKKVLSPIADALNPLAKALSPRNLVRDAGLPKEVKQLGASEKLLYKEFQKNPTAFQNQIKDAEEAKKLGIDLPLYAGNEKLTGFAKSLAIQDDSINSVKLSTRALKNQLPVGINRALTMIGRANITPQQAGAAIKESSNNLLNTLIQQRAAKAAPIYQKLMNPITAGRYPQFNRVDGAFKILDRPIAQAVNRDIRQDAAFRDYLTKEYGFSPQTIDAIPEDSLPYLDAFKKKIDDIVQTSQRTGARGFEAQRLLDLKSELLTATDKQYPAYKKARQLWGKDSQAIERLKEDTGIGIISDLAENKLDSAGAKLADAAPELIADVKKQYGKIKGGKDAFEQAYLSGLQKKFLTTKDASIGGFTNAVIGSNYDRLRLEAAIGKPRADSLGRFAELVDKASEATRIGQRPQTAARQPVNQEIINAGNAVVDAVGNIATGGMLGAGRALLKGGVDILVQPYAKTVMENPAEQQKLFNYLFTEEGYKFVKTFEQIQKTSGNKAASKFATAIFVGAGVKPQTE